MSFKHTIKSISLCAHYYFKISECCVFQNPLHLFSLCLSPCSTLSQCCHAVVALLYPFVWQHTYIPVLPPAMLDIVCTPTPFIVGLLSSSLPQLTELPLEEVREPPILSNRGVKLNAKHVAII